MSRNKACLIAWSMFACTMIFAGILLTRPVSEAAAKAHREWLAEGAANEVAMKFEQDGFTQAYPDAAVAVARRWTDKVLVSKDQQIFEVGIGITVVEKSGRFQRFVRIVPIVNGAVFFDDPLKRRIDAQNQAMAERKEYLESVGLKESIWVDAPANWADKLSN